MSRGSLRMARLEAKASLYTLGPWPWVGAALFLGSAWIQEPSFFRQQNLDLAWPASFSTADVVSLVFVSQLFMSPSPAAARAWVRLVAAHSLAVLCTLLVLTFGVLADQLLARPTDALLLGSHALRTLVLWPAVCLVGAGAVQWQTEPVARLLWVLLAFGVQSTLLPIDLPIWERSGHSWLAVVGTVAAGSALLMSARQPSVRGDFPCA